MSSVCYEKRHDAEVMHACVPESTYYVIPGADVICLCLFNGLGPRGTKALKRQTFSLYDKLTQLLL